MIETAVHMHKWVSNNLRRTTSTRLQKKEAERNMHAIQETCNDKKEKKKDNYTYTEVGPTHRETVKSIEVQLQTYSLPTSTLELVVVYLLVGGAPVLYYCLCLVSVC